MSWSRKRFREQKNEVNDEITVIKIKIMNYENKYNDALEKLQEALAPKDGREISGLTRACIEEIFPELKESEDEKIKELLKHYLEVRRCQTKDNEEYINCNHFLAWLEKQGKQKTDIPKWKYKKDNAPLSKDCLILNRYGCVVKAVSGAIVSDAWVLDYNELAKLPKQEEKPQVEAIEEEKVDNSDKVEPKDYSSIDPLFFKTTDKPEPKFKVGEWVVSKTSNLVYRVDSILFPQSKCYYLSHNGSIVLVNFADEQNYRLWTIQDAKEGDVLSNGKMIVIFKHFEEPSCKHIVAYIGLDTIGAIQVTDDTWNFGNYKTTPATKEQRDKLLKAMADAGWTFDFEKKELKEIEFNPDSLIEESYQQQADNLIDMATENPAWSEEDDYNVQCLAAKVTSDIQNGNVDRNQELIDWLKSIKDRVQPQNLWKPSEEQMDALEHFVRSIGESGYASPYDNNTKLIYSLLEQLKQL